MNDLGVLEFRFAAKRLLLEVVACTLKASLGSRLRNGGGLLTHRTGKRAGSLRRPFPELTPLNLKVFGIVVCKYGLFKLQKRAHPRRQV